MKRFAHPTSRVGGSVRHVPDSNRFFFFFFKLSSPFCASLLLSFVLSGPYVYALYDSYGFDKFEIAQLFVAGFGSSMIMGTIVGTHRTAPHATHPPIQRPLHATQRIATLTPARARTRTWFFSQSKKKKKKKEMR